MLISSHEVIPYIEKYLECPICELSIDIVDASRITNNEEVQNKRHISVRSNGLGAVYTISVNSKKIIRWNMIAECYIVSEKKTA